MFGKKAKQIKEQAALIAQMQAKIEELTHQNERLAEKVDEIRRFCSSALF